MLGLDFREKGIRFKPGLPLEEYEFTSPLLGLKKTTDGLLGLVRAVGCPGKWELEFRLPAEELARLKQLKINGGPTILVIQRIPSRDGRDPFSGEFLALAVIDRMRLGKFS